MKSARARRRTRRIIGVLPRIGGWLAAGGRWLLRHPQPLILAVVLSFGVSGLQTYAQRANTFRISRVLLPADSALRLRSPLIGENLWAVDLQAVARDLEQQQPWLKEVRVIRQMPDTVRIDPIARVPVAQLKLDRWYDVDQEGFVLPEPKSGPEERAVQVTGVSGLRPGRPNTDERLQLALRVLAEVKHSRPAIARRVTEINVAYPQEIRFMLDGETEIRCGSETELAAHLERLQGALKALAKQSLAVRYIDLRFQEPVIGSGAG